MRQHQAQRLFLRQFGVKPCRLLRAYHDVAKGQNRHALIRDETPVFLAEDGGEKLGYAFCLFQRHRNDGALNDFDALYIDDLCVDEAARGKHVGTALFDFVRRFAQENGCRCVTLNVWTGNDSARAFYDKRGMKPQKTMLELQLGVRSEELQ